MNRIAPENVKEIFKELTHFAINRKEMCEVLIDEIIEKVWVQPKYAASYAKLCQYFANKIDNKDFKFKLEEK